MTASSAPDWPALREKRVVVNMKDGYLRASLGFFNNEEDLETLLRALPS